MSEPVPIWQQRREDLAALEPSIIEGRVPPNDLDAEAAVLSSVMVDPLALDKVASFLKAEDFYSEAHRRMYEACLELRDKAQPVDVVQVGTLLKNNERIAQVGGMSYLTEVLNAAPFVANIVAYARTVREKARVRRLIATCQRIAAQGYIDYGEAQEFIEDAEAQVSAIARETATQTTVHITEGMKEFFEEAKNPTDFGVATGYDRYDRMTGGHRRGELTIIAARPGMGKTSLMLNQVVTIAMPKGMRITDLQHGVAAFSFEMPRRQLAGRIAHAEARVDVSKSRTGFLTPMDWGKLTEASAEVCRLPIWVNSDSTMKVADIAGAVRRLKAEHDGRPWTRNDHKYGPRPMRISAVMIDYLQLMKAHLGKGSSREQEVGAVARGLKNMAMELDVAVIALSQLNRSVETRSEKNKRPQLSDLRESGEIEQAADAICFIYRDEYYNRDTTEERNIAELIVAKQRNGPTGICKVRFDSEYTRFDNLAEGEYVDDESN